MTQSDQTSALRRDRVLLLAAIALLTLLAWGYILHLAASMSAMGMPMGADAQAMDMSSMPGMDMSRGALAPVFRPWGPVGFALVFLMWAVMMVGMMLPSVTPMVLLYAATARHQAASPRPLASTMWFVGGYLAAWVGFSLAATAAQWGLTRLALLTPMMASTSAVLGGLLLIGAGLYQWSPLKRACLAHCQTPLNFLMQHGGFRPGLGNALRQGVHHGLHCVGCCALLMTLLFVGGVMNVLWIAGLSLLVLVEKVWTRPIVAPIAGTALIAVGLAMVVRH